MTQPRIHVREQGASASAAAFGAAGGVVHLKDGSSTAVANGDGTSPRTFWSLAARLVRSAAVAVALMMLVPIGLVAVRGDNLARSLHQWNTNAAARVAAVDGMRPFRLPADRSITPIQAGRALNALLPSRTKSPGFDLTEPSTPPILPWQAVPMAPGMFATARSNFYDGPSSQTILEAVARGFSASERAYLQALATSPAWRDFDLVARAPAVDVVGGRFKTPFAPEALPAQRPIPSFRTSREFAYAGVARAAYYMSAGHRDSAETALRSIVSYGFAMIDNGTTSTEGLFGAVIVGVGRDALQRFYLIQHDPRAGLPALAPVKSAPTAASRAVLQLSAADARRRLLARIEDPAVPLGERFDGLQNLSLASCTNVRELMFGPASDVTGVLGRAPNSVARFPSEQALVELQSRLPLASESASLGPIQSVAASAASVAGVVTRNPRLATCTRVLTWGW